MTDLEIQPIVRRRAAEEAIHILQEQIREGRFQPGERLPSERALAEALRVSRPTVREAVQALAAMNILEVRHGSGIYIASLEFAELMIPVEFALELTDPTVRSLFEVRLALEPLASELAARRATELHAAALEDCLRRTKRPRISRSDLIDLDIELHGLIVEASDNPLLKSVVKSLSVLSRKSRELTVRRAGAVPRAVAEHDAIVRAIVRRQPGQARQAMTDHLLGVWTALDSSSVDK